jgi:hypothetical protein
MKTETPTGDLIPGDCLTFSAAIYPRQSVSEQHVNEIADALRSGHEMPCILVDRKAKVIVDGVHRWRAYAKVYGNEAEIPCVLRDFATENDLFIAAIEANSAHGLPYTSFEQTQCILAAKERGIALEVLSQAMHITIEKIDRIVVGKTGFERVGEEDRPIALKGSMHQLKGRTLNKLQLEANRYAGGMKPQYYINQLTALVRGGLCAWGGENVLVSLRQLRDLLNEKIK